MQSQVCVPTDKWVTQMIFAGRCVCVCVCARAMLYGSYSCTDLNYAVKRLQLSSGVIVLVDAAKVHPQIALQGLVNTCAGQTCANS